MSAKFVDARFFDGVESNGLFLDVLDSFSGAGVPSIYIEVNGSEGIYLNYTQIAELQRRLQNWLLDNPEDNSELWEDRP